MPVIEYDSFNMITSNNMIREYNLEIVPNKGTKELRILIVDWEPESDIGYPIYREHLDSFGL